MKKTEKIEVRVSYEEKERLTELAEQRNQNISELIRDRMAGQYTVPAQTISRDIMWNRGISVVALVLGSIAFLWGIIGMMVDGKSNASPILSTVQMTEAEEFFPALETKIAHRDGFTKSYIIQTAEGSYQTSHLVEEAGGVFQLKVGLCRVEGESCVPLQSKELILSPPSRNARQSTALFFDQEQPIFKVTAFPQPQSETEKSES
ncbi:MAG: ribbon-helix-helix domain-containing protein [Litorimonas sp.]